MRPLPESAGVRASTACPGRSRCPPPSPDCTPLAESAIGRQPPGNQSDCCPQNAPAARPVPGSAVAGIASARPTPGARVSPAPARHPARIPRQAPSRSPAHLRDQGAAVRAPSPPGATIHAVASGRFRLPDPHICGDGGCSNYQSILVAMLQNRPGYQAGPHLPCLVRERSVGWMSRTASAQTQTQTQTRRLRCLNPPRPVPPTRPPHGSRFRRITRRHLRIGGCHISGSIMASQGSRPCCGRTPVSLNQGDSECFPLWITHAR